MTDRAPTFACAGCGQERDSAQLSSQLADGTCYCQDCDERCSCLHHVGDDPACAVHSVARKEAA